MNAPYMVRTTTGTYWGLRRHLEERLPFVYTRFGDGELDLIDGGFAAGQPFNPNLAEDVSELLRAAGTDARILNALATHDPEPGMEGGLFLGWTNPAYDRFKSRPYENAIALHYYAVFKPHLLRQFFDLMRDRKKLVIMSDPLGDLLPLVGNYDLLLVPGLDAHSTIDQWYPSLAKYDLILMACGAAKCSANLRLLGEDRFVQSIDLGSLADFALGVESRTWIKMANEKYPNARKVLLGG